MGSYLGLHADLYDLFYAEKDYHGEADFVSNLLGKHEGKLIELACGTGTHALILEKKGYEVTATDYSSDMLRIALKKGEVVSSGNSYEVANMMDLPYEDGVFDHAVCLFDSIGYLQTNEQILKALKEINRVLKKDGTFVFEFWHAAPMITGFDPVRVKHFETATQKITRTSRTTMDVEKQLCTVAFEIEIKEGDQTQTINEAQTNRFFLCQEFALLLKQAGFKSAEFYDGFQDAEVNKDTWHVITHARK